MVDRRTIIVDTAITVGSILLAMLCVALGVEGWMLR